jgi:four helix bundle protein
MNELTIREVDDLKVYQKAYSISLEIHKASLHFPQIEQFAMADQMRRASKSVCANLAEGYSKQHVSKAEFKRYLLMAMGSADECAYGLNTAKT